MVSAPRVCRGPKSVGCVERSDRDTSAALRTGFGRLWCLLGIASERGVYARETDGVPQMGKP